MSQRSFLQSQLIETDRLLTLAGDHPLMAPSLRQRREALARELESLEPTIEPRTVLFFTGDPVLGSQGISAEFAAKVLQPFLEMVKTQYSASKHGRVGARGPRRDESEAQLLLTGLPRGSFGLELSRPNPEDLFSGQHLAEVLVKLTGLIRSTAESDEDFATTLEEISPRVLPKLKDFLETISNSQADIRVVSGDLECKLGRVKVSEAFRRASGTKSEEETLEALGVFRGATLDSWRFDFRRSSDKQIISGRIGDDVTEIDAQNMSAFTNQECMARLHQTTLTTLNGVRRTRFELLEIKPPNAAM